MVCERCFKTTTDGEHGVGLCPYEPRSRGAAIQVDDIPGGIVIENGFKTPQTFYSKSAMDRAFAENGLTRKERWAPTPGSDIDPAGVQNSARYIDPYTMENARILLSREVPRSPDFVDLNPPIVRAQFIAVDGGKDAQKMMDGDQRRAARVGRRLNKIATKQGGAGT